MEEARRESGAGGADAGARPDLPANVQALVDKLELNTDAAVRQREAAAREERRQARQARRRERRETARAYAKACRIPLGRGWRKARRSA